jgi:hypothetical protein
MIKMTPMIPAGFTGAMLQRSPAANQLQNEDDQRNQEQDVNVGAENVESDESKQPKNQQNQKDGPKHKFLSVEVVDLSSLCHARLRVTILDGNDRCFIYPLS